MTLVLCVKACKHGKEVFIGSNIRRLLRIRSCEPKIVPVNRAYYHGGFSFDSPRGKKSILTLDSYSCIRK